MNSTGSRAGGVLLLGGVLALSIAVAEAAPGGAFPEQWSKCRKDAECVIHKSESPKGLYVLARKFKPALEKRLKEASAKPAAAQGESAASGSGSNVPFFPMYFGTDASFVPPEDASEMDYRAVCRKHRCEAEMIAPAKAK